eukprot:scaffold116147_cov17-Tisochrysis_lutea.AAC.2
MLIPAPHTADEDHGAAAAAAAAAASLTEADTQQLSQLTEHAACSSTEAASLTEADTQQLSSPQGSPQQQQECLPACELQHHDLQGGAQATALGAMNGATPEPPLVFEFLQQPTSLQQRHVHARADPGTFFAAAPAAPAPADSPAAAAARIAGPPGGEEGGERSAATAAAAAAATAMLEHAANVVAGHVLGECDEVSSASSLFCWCYDGCWGSAPWLIGPVHWWSVGFEPVHWVCAYVSCALAVWMMSECEQVWGSWPACWHGRNLWVFMVDI